MAVRGESESNSPRLGAVLGEQLETPGRRPPPAAARRQHPPPAPAAPEHRQQPVYPSGGRPPPDLTPIADDFPGWKMFSPDGRFRGGKGVGGAVAARVDARCSALRYAARRGTG